MRALILLPLLLSGCGMGEAVRDADAWRAEAEKFKRGLERCDKAYEESVADAIENSAMLRSCRSGVRAL